MVTQYTRRFDFPKEQSLLHKQDDDVDKGNGFDLHVPIGTDPADSNDRRYRAVMQAALDWTDVYQIVSATLCYTSSVFAHLTSGSARDLQIRRIDETEGVWNVGGGSEGNWVETAKTVYPGPTTTGTTISVTTAMKFGRLPVR